VHGCANLLAFLARTAQPVSPQQVAASGYILKRGAVHPPDPPGLVHVGDLYQLYGLTEEGIVVVEGR